MKENKFRAWDIKNKLYIYLIGYIIDNNTIRLWWKYNQGSIFNESFPIDQIILEQYTGYFNSYLGDKAIVSGEEDYSNDQFNTDYDWEFSGIVKEVDGVIVVEDKSKCGIPFCDIINEGLDIKINGNIHE